MEVRMRWILFLLLFPLVLCLGCPTGLPNEDGRAPDTGSDASADTRADLGGGGDMDAAPPIDQAAMDAVKDSSTKDKARPE